MAVSRCPKTTSRSSNLSACPQNEPLKGVDKPLSDEDEIVWSINGFNSGEDFILIPKLHSPPELPPVISNLETTPPLDGLPQYCIPDPTSTVAPTKPTFHSPKSMSYEAQGSANRRSVMVKLSSSSAQPHRVRRRRGKKDVSSYPSPSPSPERNLTHNISSTGDTERTDTIRFGARPLVEESDGDCHPILTKYEDAVNFITLFLSDPPAPCTTFVRLTFLQSLIIELGLISAISSLPSSLKSARRLLKSHAFINITEYLSVREQGPEKLQEILFPSKQELTRDLRRKKGSKKADRGWVKQHGLSVLLVSVF